jgi:hypothetical protein
MLTFLFLVMSISSAAANYPRFIWSSSFMPTYILQTEETPQGRSPPSDPRPLTSMDKNRSFPLPGISCALQRHMPLYSPPCIHSQLPEAGSSGVLPPPTQHIRQANSLMRMGTPILGNASNWYDGADVGGPGRDVMRDVIREATDADTSIKPPTRQQTEVLDHLCPCPNVMPGPTPAVDLFSRQPDSGRYVTNDGLPRFEALFGPRHLSRPNSGQGQRHETSQTQSSDHGPQAILETPRDGSMNPSSQSHPDLSVFSTTSSRTTEDHPSAQECRYDAIQRLYSICQGASATYAQSLHRPARRGLPTANSPGMHGQREGRYHPYEPYTPASHAHPQGRSSRTHGGAELTLMDHVSVICTYMWRRARAGLIAPHRAELTAVRDMGNLYTWSAALVDYLEKNYGPGAIGMEEGEREGAGGRTGPVPASAVGHMAMKLCRHFGNSEGVRACESIPRMCRIGGAGAS